SRPERHARRSAGRVPHGVWPDGGERTPCAGARLDSGRDTDGPVFPRTADRPRHGRLRPDGFVSAIVHRRAANHLHPHIRPIGRAGTMLDDVRHTVRFLLREPLLAAAVLVTLGVAMGLNTAIFSVLDAVVLRPLPYPSPGQLVEVSQLDRVDGSP